MIKGKINLKIIENERIVKEFSQENLILNSGLLSMVNGTAFTNFLIVGSNDFEAKVTDPGVLSPLFSTPYGSSVIYDDDNEMVYRNFSAFVDRLQGLGDWAEIGIGTFNRLLFKESGTLPISTNIYAITSINQTGESPYSDPISIDVLNPSGSVKLSWEPPTDQSSSSRVPESYIIYKDISGTYTRLKTIDVESERMYYYDRGDNYQGGIRQALAHNLESPINFSGIYINGTTPFAFTKTNMQQVQVSLNIYLSNFDQLNYE